MTEPYYTDEQAREEQSAGLPMSLCPELTMQGHGTAVMTRHYADDGRTVDYITVDHADPHIRISDEFLVELFQTGTHPYRPDIRLEVQYEHKFTECRLDGRCFNSALLHIDGRNRHVVYRIGAYVPEDNTWRASWPD
ncbi:hypothetical protein [Mycobacterium sp. 23]|uniref:hypothetical protein n=1 Tax=Mycobacterium sp. 23 TaxID=3400424 RepID=UPI003AAB523D